MRKLILMLILSLSVFSISLHAEDADTKNRLTLNTNAFLDKGLLPVLYTCDGKDISPKLEWTTAPINTKSFALMLVDINAKGGEFYHWIIYNMPPTSNLLEEGEQRIPAGATLGTNSFGKQQYNGPCPPRDSTHTYVFTLYALNKKLTLPANADGKIVLEAIQKSNPLATAKLTAIYTRWIT